jgi:hypothetical protein
MKHQQITNLLELHKSAVYTLNQIVSIKADIKHTQDRLLLNSKDPLQTTRTRAYHEDQLNDLLAEQRKLQDMHIEKYAIIAQQLAEPFVPKETYLVTTHEMVSI